MIIELFGSVPSKKNNYTPRKGGRGGMFKSKELQAELDNLEQQFPGDMRDLQLKHPVISFKFYILKSGVRKDRDGMLTTLLDLMVDCGTIINDNIEEFNGCILVYPAKIADRESVKISILDEGNDPEEAGIDDVYIRNPALG